MTDLFDALFDLPMLLRSRVLTAILIAVVVALVCLEAHTLATGTWWNVGSAPPGTGCRYWTGTKLVYLTELDAQRCPIRLDR